MISQSAPELPATIIHTAQGAWCCSACGGFVRQDARMCNHCDRAFERVGPELSPTVTRVVLSLLGAAVILGSFVIGGMLLGGYLWPGHGDATLGPSGSVFGGSTGVSIGMLVALRFMEATLQSR